MARASGSVVLGEPAVLVVLLTGPGRPLVLLRHRIPFSPDEGLGTVAGRNEESNLLRKRAVRGGLVIWEKGDLPRPARCHYSP